MKALLLILILIPSVHALTIGVSPPRIIEHHLLPESVFQETIALSKDGTQDILMSVEVTGDAASWVNYPTEVLLPGEVNNVLVPLNITVPKNTDPGNYSATMLYSVPNENISIALSVILDLTVVDEEWVYYEIKHPAAEQQNGKTTLSFTVDNKGNTAAGPSTAHITIFDHLREQKIFEDDGRVTEIQAFSTEERAIIFKTELPNGLYWVNITLDDYSELIALEVQENYVPPNDPLIIIIIVVIILIAGLVRYMSSKKGG